MFEGSSIRLDPPIVLVALTALTLSCTGEEVLGAYPSSQDSQTSSEDTPSEHKGSSLLSEGFDDPSYAERGWYDGPGGDFSGNAVKGEAFECLLTGGQPCERPGRIAFDEENALFVSYWIRYSDSYDLGEEVAQLFLLTNADTEYVGPALSHLTVFFSQSEGHAQVGLLGVTNVDLECVLNNDGSFEGCDGSFTDYAFSEQRSVNACNGINADPTHASCSANDFGGYYSFRGFASAEPAFTDAKGPGYKADWHHVEALVELNSVSKGVGQADGRIRYWLDERRLIDIEDLILRTGEFPKMRFQHLLIAPIAVDSNLDQSLFIDELQVARGLP